MYKIKQYEDGSINSVILNNVKINNEKVYEYNNSKIYTYTVNIKGMYIKIESKYKYNTENIYNIHGIIKEKEYNNRTFKYIKVEHIENGKNEEPDNNVMIRGYVKEKNDENIKIKVYKNIINIKITKEKDINIDDCITIIGKLSNINNSIEILENSTYINKKKENNIYYGI